MKSRIARLGVAVLLVATVAACKKKGPEETAASGAALAEVGAVAFPEDVLAFGQAKSLDDFTAALSGIIGKFEPQAATMVAAQVPAVLQGQLLAARNMDWFDAKKPIRFVVLDYKKFTKPVALVLPLKGGKEALMAALPESKSDGAPDNETRYSTPLGLDLYVNVVGGAAVFTFEPKAFAAAKPFLQGDFARIESSELFDAQVSAKNFRRIAGPDIEKFRQEIANLPPPEGPIQIPGLQELLKKEVEMLLSLVDQAETGRLVLAYDGRDLAVRASAKVVEGQGLARFAASMKDRKLELHRMLPPGGWMVVAANVDPKAFEGWARLGLDFYAGLLQLNEQEKKHLDELAAQSLDNQTGESVFYLGRDGDFPFRLITVTGVRDGDKAKAQMNEIVAFLLSKVGALVRQYAAQAPEPVSKLDFSSPKALLAGVKPLLATNGIAVRERSETVSGAQVDAIELSVDYQKIPEALRSEEGLAEAQKVLGSKISGAIGSDKTRVYFAIGRDAVADIGLVATGGSAGQNPLDALVAKAPFAVAGVGYLSLAEVFRIISRLSPGFAEDLPNLGSIQDDVPVTFLLGTHADRVMDASLTIPLSGIASLLPKQRAEAPIAPAPTAPTEPAP